MPAYNYPFKIAIMVTVLSLSLAQPVHFASAASTSQAVAIKSALNWLSSNENADGSYGPFSQIRTAYAAYALWLNNSHSAKAATSYSWLASQMDSSSSDLWAYPEADIPGEIFYSLSASSNLGLLHNSSDTTALLSMQESTGGFKGYYDSSGSQVTSSIDTDMALLGLIAAKAIPALNQTDAISYLFSLQNSDGSFNLTSNTRANSFDTLGPDPVSITGITLLALQSAGLSADDSRVSKALTFLNAAASSSFNGHVYAAAVSALALKAYDEPANVVTSVVYILSQQNIDGGFNDTSRSSPHSNAFDTGWVATALEAGFSEEAPAAAVNSPPTASFAYGPTSPSVGITIHFNASSSRDSDGDQLSYQWTFGDGFTATGLTPSHTYSQPGNFTVILTVTDSGTNPAALSNTKSQTMTVQPGNVQTTPKLPFTGAGRLVLLGIVGLVVIAGVAVYLVVRRRDARPLMPQS